MLGLTGVDGRPLMRPYYLASPASAGELEFYSIKVPGGRLTSKLQELHVGDPVLIGRNPMGALVHASLSPSRRLYLFAGGTGIAPFVSLARDPRTWDRYGEIVVAHTAKQVQDLNFLRVLRQDQCDPAIAALAGDRLRYFPTATHEPFVRRGRIVDFVKEGVFARELGLPPFNPGQDRVMICGDASMANEFGKILAAAGFEEGSPQTPGQFVSERAFVDVKPARGADTR